MKAISIRSPWVQLVVEGVKTVENRVGGTGHRGPLAIHVAKTLDEGALLDPRVRRALGAETGSARDRLEAITAARDHHAATAGHIIAVAELVDSHEAAPACCLEWGDRHAPNGRVMRHLVLAGARRLARPIRHGGMLGLWTVDDDLIDRAGWES